MIALDEGGLVVIGARLLGIDTGSALEQLDLTAARAALAQARRPECLPGLPVPGPATVAADGIGLMHALLQHRPLPRLGEQLAVAAGLQFLSVNGWQADLDPPEAAAVVVEALASGRLSPDRAAVWLSPRLSPRLDPRIRRATGAAHRVARAPTRRILVSTGITIAAGGIALLATACSRGQAAPAGHPGGPPAVVQQSTAPAGPSHMIPPRPTQRSTRGNG